MVSILKIIENFLTNNDCYKAQRKIDVKGLMIHSTGVNQPNASIYMNAWNRPASEQGGRQVCVHAFVESNGNVYMCLPWNHRGWHAGGSANNTHIGIEMCEGDLDDKEYFEKIYNVTVELAVYISSQYGLNPYTDIICHSEGYKLRYSIKSRRRNALVYKAQ